MIWQKTNIILLAGLCLLPGCLSKSNNSQIPEQQFFDIATFVAQYSDSKMHVVKKSISVDGRLESKTLDDYNIGNDIKGFENYSINKPALFDKYEVDSILGNSGELIKLVYTGLKEELRVQKMEVEIDESTKPRRIFLQLKTDSFLEDIDMEISWVVDSSYKIVKREKRIFGNEHVHVIEVIIQS
ncbi:MAG: hypothetical protein OEQ53_17170 [Saprospiraceae bacterium]|nr:hypothetical protein [Saprospiraceae bacterium]